MIRIVSSSQIKGKVGDSLRDAISSGHLAKAQSLISLKTDVPLEMARDRIWLDEKDEDLWQAYCEKYNLRSFMRPPIGASTRP